MMYQLQKLCNLLRIEVMVMSGLFQGKQNSTAISYFNLHFDSRNEVFRKYQISRLEGLSSISYLGWKSGVKLPEIEAKVWIF